MEKLLLIQSSAYPDGSKVKYLFGMKQPQPVRITSRDIKRLYGAKNSRKQNTVRKGGVCYQDLPLIEQAKKIINR